MRLTVATLLTVGVLAASCADDAAESSTDPKGPGGSSTSDLVNTTVPDNLCDEVLPAIPPEYDVAEVSHDSDETSATCSLASEAGATTLELTLTMAEPSALEDAFTAACEEVVRPEPQDQQERRCTATTDDQVVTQAVSISARSAVLLMVLVSDAPERIRTAGTDLALVESAVASG